MLVKLTVAVEMRKSTLAVYGGAAVETFTYTIRRATLNESSLALFKVITDLMRGRALFFQRLISVL